MTRKSSIRSKMAAAAPAAAIGLIGVLGVLKALDLQSFFDAIRTWSIVSPFVAKVLVFAVPEVEMLLAITWFLGGRRTTVLVCAFTFLAILTVAYSLELGMGGVPTCGCLGSLGGRLNGWDSPWANIVRNLLLLGLMGSGFVFKVRRRSISVQEGESDNALG